MTDSTRALEDLTDRVKRLEQKVAATEVEGTATPVAPVAGEVFWALEALRARVDDVGAVLFTGTVTLPTQERAEWQQGSTTESLLEADWTETTDVLAALGHPVRLLLLREVLRGARSVGELGAVEGLGTSGQLYHHLRQLVAAGWLRTSGRGRYEVPAARVVPLLVVVAAAQR